MLLPYLRITPYKRMTAAEGLDNQWFYCDIPVEAKITEKEASKLFKQRKQKQLIYEIENQSQNTEDDEADLEDNSSYGEEDDWENIFQQEKTENLLNTSFEKKGEVY